MREVVPIQGPLFFICGGQTCRNHRTAHRAFTGPLYGCRTVISTGAHTHFSEVGRVGFSVADYGSVSLPGLYFTYMG